MNRHIYRLVVAVLAAITIVSCNGARKSETFRLLEERISIRDAEIFAFGKIAESPKFSGEEDSSLQTS